MELESIGLICVILGLVALLYVVLYGYARNNPAQNQPADTIPFEPFSIFSAAPIWRQCMHCHAYAYTTNTLCTAHLLPAPLVPLSRQTRYRVQRMSGVCIHVGDICEDSREDFERFALTLMAAHPEIYWGPDEMAGLYHLDAYIGNDTSEGGEYAVL